MAGRGLDVRGMQIEKGWAKRRARERATGGRMGGGEWAAGRIVGKAKTMNQENQELLNNLLLAISPKSGGNFWPKMTMKNFLRNLSTFKENRRIKEIEIKLET